MFQHVLKFISQQKNGKTQSLEWPDLVDDFYLNLVDWSSQNVIAAAHYHGVYCARVGDDVHHEVLLIY